MVTQAYFRGGLFSFKPQFQGLNQPDQQGAIQEAQIIEYPVPADIAGQRLLNLGNENALSRCLPRISTAKPEHFFEQFFVPFLPSRSHAEIMLDGPFDYCFVKVVCERRP
jgi:hypothetical protein